VRLETERLVLRPWEDRDRLPLARIMGDAHVRRFYPRVLTPEETEAELNHHLGRAAVNGFHFQAAEAKLDGALVGLLGLGVIPDATREAIPSHPEVEIGWVFAERFWGQGLAPEGAAAWLQHAWSLGLPEVVAFTAAINRPSQRVMQKIGMVRDPADDFSHPRIAEGHPLRPHVLYRIASPAAPR
jgi:RimJ/RimL family protein N-acetyltransferase